MISMEVNKNQARNSEGCSDRLIRAMERFLWTLIGNDSKDDVVTDLKICGDAARPYLDVVNGNDPGNTLSAALSYYQYVKLVRGELKVSRDYLIGIGDDPNDPGVTYSLIIENMTRALRAQDYVTAAFLADLAFIIRSYALCLGNNDRDVCDWIKRAFTARVLIMRRTSNY